MNCLSPINEDFLCLDYITSYLSTNIIPFFTVFFLLLLIIVFIYYTKQTQFGIISNSQENQKTLLFKQEEVELLLQNCLDTFDYCKLREIYKEIIYKNSSIITSTKFFEVLFKAISISILPNRQYNTILLSELDYYLLELKRLNIITTLDLYNSIIDSYIKLAQYKTAFHYFQQMRFIIKPNIITYFRLFESMSYYNFNEIYINYLNDNLISIQSKASDELKGLIIDQLIPREKYNDAIAIFNSIELKQSESFTMARYESILNAFLLLKQYENVVSLYSLLIKSPTIYSTMTIITHYLVLKAYCHLNYIENAKETYTYIKHSYPNIKSFIYNHLAEAFFYCKQFNYIIKIMNEAEELDIDSYFILMKVYFIKNDQELILKTLDKMLKKNIMPDIRIYVLMINLFLQMKKIDQVIGILNDIKINKMPATSEIYAMIINACFIYGYLEKGIELIYETEELTLQLQPSQIKVGIEFLIKHHEMIKNKNDNYLSQYNYYANELNSIFQRYGFVYRI